MASRQRQQQQRQAGAQRQRLVAALAARVAQASTAGMQAAERAGREADGVDDEDSKRRVGDGLSRSGRTAALSDLKALNAAVRSRNVTSSVRKVESTLLGRRPAPATRAAAAAATTSTTAAAPSSRQRPSGEFAPRVRLRSRPASSLAGRRRSICASKGLAVVLPLADGDEGERGSPVTEGSAKREEEWDARWATGSSLGALPDFGLQRIASFLTPVEWRSLSRVNVALRRVLSPGFTMASIVTRVTERGRVRLLRTRVVTPLAARLCGVTHLKVVGGVLQPESLPVFTKTLPLWKRLEVLELSSCMVDTACMTSLVAALPLLPHLAALDLSRNLLDDAGAGVLARSIRSCVRLEILDVRDNYIRDKGVALLAMAAAQCARLWSLSMSGNTVSPAAMASVASSVRDSQGRLCDVDM